MAFQSRKQSSKRRGNTIIITLGVVVLVAGMSSAALDKLVTTRKLLDVSTARQQAVAAAEAVCSFRETRLVDIAANNDLTFLTANPDSLTDTTINASDPWEGTQYFGNCVVRWRVEPIAVQTESRDEWTVNVPPTISSMSLMADGTSGFDLGTKDDSKYIENYDFYHFRIAAEAYYLENKNYIAAGETITDLEDAGKLPWDNPGTYTAAVQTSRVVQLRINSLFKYALFYAAEGDKGDLEIGPGDPMVIAGAAHSNGAVFAAGGAGTEGYKVVDGGGASFIEEDTDSIASLVGYEGIFRLSKKMFEQAKYDGSVPSVVVGSEPQDLDESLGIINGFSTNEFTDEIARKAGHGGSYSVGGVDLTAENDTRAGSPLSVVMNGGNKMQTAFGALARDGLYGDAKFVKTLANIPELAGYPFVVHKFVPSGYNLYIWPDPAQFVEANGDAQNPAAYNPDDLSTWTIIPNAEPAKYISTAPNIDGRYEFKETDSTGYIEVDRFARQLYYVDDPTLAINYTKNKYRRYSSGSYSNVNPRIDFDIDADGDGLLDNSGNPPLFPVSAEGLRLYYQRTYASVADTTGSALYEKAGQELLDIADVYDPEGTGDGRFNGLPNAQSRITGIDMSDNVVTSDTSFSKNEVPGYYFDIALNGDPKEDRDTKSLIIRERRQSRGAFDFTEPVDYYMDDSGYVYGVDGDKYVWMDGSVNDTLPAADANNFVTNSGERVVNPALVMRHAATNIVPHPSDSSSTVNDYYNIHNDGKWHITSQFDYHPYLDHVQWVYTRTGGQYASYDPTTAAWVDETGATRTGQISITNGVADTKFGRATFSPDWHIGPPVQQSTTASTYVKSYTSQTFNPPNGDTVGTHTAGQYGSRARWQGLTIHTSGEYKIKPRNTSGSMTNTSVSIKLSTSVLGSEDSPSSLSQWFGSTLGSLKFFRIFGTGTAPDGDGLTNTPYSNSGADMGRKNPFTGVYLDQYTNAPTGGNGSGHYYSNVQNSDLAKHTSALAQAKWVLEANGITIDRNALYPRPIPFPDSVEAAVCAAIPLWDTNTDGQLDWDADNDGYYDHELGYHVYIRNAHSVDPDGTTTGRGLGGDLGHYYFKTGAKVTIESINEGLEVTGLGHGELPRMWDFRITLDYLLRSYGDGRYFLSGDYNSSAAVLADVQTYGLLGNQLFNFNDIGTVDHATQAEYEQRYVDKIAALSLRWPLSDPTLMNWTAFTGSLSNYSGSKVPTGGSIYGGAAGPHVGSYTQGNHEDYFAALGEGDFLPAKFTGTRGASLEGEGVGLPVWRDSDGDNKCDWEVCSEDADAGAANQILKLNHNKGHLQMTTHGADAVVLEYQGSLVSFGNDWADYMANEYLVQFGEHDITEQFFHYDLAGYALEAEAGIIEANSGGPERRKWPEEYLIAWEYDFTDKREQNFFGMNLKGGFQRGLLTDDRGASSSTNGSQRVPVCLINMRRTLDFLENTKRSDVLDGDTSDQKLNTLFSGLIYMHRTRRSDSYDPRYPRWSIDNRDLWIDTSNGIPINWWPDKVADIDQGQGAHIRHAGTSVLTDLPAGWKTGSGPHATFKSSFMIYETEDLDYGINYTSGAYSRKKGLVVMSPNRIYVWGNYNTVEHADSDGADQIIPSAIFSDGIVVLSEDSDFYGNRWSTVAQVDTTLNVSVITNNIPTFVHNGSRVYDSGGAHNAVKLHGSWNIWGRNNDLNIKGSLVVLNERLYGSEHISDNSIKAYNYSPAYQPPNRNYEMNTDLYSRGGQPPFTPYGVKVIRTVNTVESIGSSE